MLIGTDKFTVDTTPDSSRDHPNLSESSTTNIHIQPTPVALAADASGRLLISCLDGNTILRYSIRERKFEVLAGQPGANGYRDGRGASECRLSDAAMGITVDPNQNVYFCDSTFGALRAISLTVWENAILFFLSVLKMHNLQTVCF